MSLVSKGRGAAAYNQTHARILLFCDENQADGPMKDEDIARALKVGTATVERVRRGEHVVQRRCHESHRQWAELQDVPRPGPEHPPRSLRTPAAHHWPGLLRLGAPQAPAGSSGRTWRRVV